MNIGQKLKSLRILNNMTQEELAIRSDLTRGFISQLERNLSSPTIENLELILRALGTDLVGFFSSLNEQEKVVYKKSERIPIYDSPDGVKEQLLMTTTEPKKIEPSILTIKPGASTQVEQSHEGFEFGYIIKGKIEIFLDDSKYKANEGECFFFKSNKKHFIKNSQKNNISEVIWIEIY